MREELNTILPSASLHLPCLQRTNATRTRDFNCFSVYTIIVGIQLLKECNGVIIYLSVMYCKITLDVMMGVLETKWFKLNGNSWRKSLALAFFNVILFEMRHNSNIYFNFSVRQC